MNGTCLPLHWMKRSGSLWSCTCSWHCHLIGVWVWHEFIGAIVKITDWLGVSLLLNCTPIWGLQGHSWEGCEPRVRGAILLYSLTCTWSSPPVRYLQHGLPGVLLATSIVQCSSKPLPVRTRLIHLICYSAHRGFFCPQQIAGLEALAASV